jgi:hypothetical protein
MRNNDTFQGSIKTKRAKYEEFNELRALWFSDGFKNSYKIVKEKIKDKWFFLILESGDGSPDKAIFKIEIKGVEYD